MRIPALDALGTRSWTALCVAVGIAASIVLALGSWIPSFWSDEAATVRVSSLRPAEMLAFLAQKDAVHGAYDLAMHAWSLVFGTSEAALRAPSAIGAGIAIGGTAYLGGQLGRRRTGLVAALVLAVLPRMTVAAVEARSYALTAALAVLVTIAFVRVVRRPGIGPWIVYTALAVLSVQLFLYSILLVAAHGIVLAVVTRSRRRMLAFGVSAVVVALCSVPLLLVVVSQRDQIAWLGEQAVLTPWTVLVEPWAESSGVLGILLWLGLVAAAALLVVRRRAAEREVGDLRREHRPTFLPTLALAWVAVPLVALLLATAVLGPLYTARYLTFCAPGAALGLAVVLQRVAGALGARGGVLVTASLVVLALVSLPTMIGQRTAHAKNGGSDLRDVALALRSASMPGDALVFDRSSSPTRDARQSLYAYPDAFTAFEDIAVIEHFPATGTISDRTTDPSDLDPLAIEADRLWIVLSTVGESTASSAEHCAASDAVGHFVESDRWSAADSTATERATLCLLVASGSD